ncbi:hypothetical protein IQ07DRAFT_590133 [Pyrenochaeta sp. DS3sAY3a]|nr:hypothetical protein IQ07DRAFT_590133 [Pyrenochaeta sp. DS3sAY3a]
MSRQSRNLRGSLESSWSDAEYSSEEGASVDTASDFASDDELEQSDLDVAHEEHNVAQEERSVAQEEEESVAQEEQDVSQEGQNVTTPVPAKPNRRKVLDETPESQNMSKKASKSLSKGPPSGTHSRRLQKSGINHSQTPDSAKSKKSKITSKSPPSGSQSRPLQKSDIIHSETPDSAKSTVRKRRAVPGDNHFEPSFIMPSMHDSPNGYTNGSPLRKPHVRQRNARQPPSYDDSQASPQNVRAPRIFAQQQTEKESNPWYYVSLFFDNVVIPLVAYVLNVLSYSMRHIVKPFLGVAFGIAILVFGLQTATGVLRNSITNALSPICLLPGSSYIIPYCATDPSENHEADFENLINAQSRFEDILESSKDSTSLPLTIKSSELAIRDLRTLVRYSKLPSRHELDNEFHYFVLTASKASDDLLRYNSRIGAAIDRVIATNTWTMTVLQGIEEREASIGVATRVYYAVTGPFIAPPRTLQQRIFDQYIQHVSTNKKEIAGLIKTAQALLVVLTNLDERLHTIYDITTRDDHTITRNQEELFSSLWTKLGGNRRDVSSNNKQLELLKNISAYRKKALMHVSGTLLKLLEIRVELENLGAGVAAPETLGHKDEIPLSFHLNVIDAAVKRLRGARGESMRVEMETYRRAVRSGEEPGLEEKERQSPVPIVTVQSRR